MNEIKEDLIREATEMFRVICPCSSKGDLKECFTTEGKKIMFWFNTSDDSTHVLTADLPDEPN